MFYSKLCQNPQLNRAAEIRDRINTHCTVTRARALALFVCIAGLFQAAFDEYFDFVFYDDEAYASV